MTSSWLRRDRHDKRDRRDRIAVIVVMSALVGIVSACGGGSTSSALADTPTCMIERSELGPFGPDTLLGASMDESTAREQMARDDVAEFIRITATGPWDDAWDHASDALGGGIHTGLTWLDVGGELRGLFEAGDAYRFDDLRVSRSFQGKIEHNTDPIFLPVPVGQDADYGAECVITSVEVGDEQTAMLTNLADELGID